MTKPQLKKRYFTESVISILTSGLKVTSSVRDATSDVQVFLLFVAVVVMGTLDILTGLGLAAEV
jgi:hypothetical protein